MVRVRQWDTAFFYLFFPFPLPFLSLSSPFPLPFLSLSSPFPLPFLSLSSPFPLLFPFPSFSFSFPFFCPFFSLFLFISYSCPFPFHVLSFSCPFPFSFLSLSFSSPFPILSFPFLYSSFSFSLSSLMWILWSRCEASSWKNDKRKKTITCGKKNTIWKGSGFLQDPICVCWNTEIVRMYSRVKVWWKFSACHLSTKEPSSPDPVKNRHLLWRVGAGWRNVWPCYRLVSASVISLPHSAKLCWNHPLKFSNMSLLWHCAEPFFDHFSRDWASRHLNHWIPTPCAIVQHSSHQRRLAGYSQFVSICASGWRNFFLDHLCHNFGWLVPLFLIDPYRSLSFIWHSLDLFGIFPAFMIR